MLTFNLKKEWFEKIARGEKTVEYRELKRYWITRIQHEAEKLGGSETVEIKGKPYVKYNFKVPFPCIFVLGYTKRKLPATISEIEIVDGEDTDLRIGKPVYAVHFELDK